MKGIKEVLNEWMRHLAELYAAFHTREIKE